ncbi:MAG: hypothetical protein AAF466_13670, partial [Bacteroidota bacterium]
FFSLILCLTLVNKGFSQLDSLQQKAQDSLILEASLAIRNEPDKAISKYNEVLDRSKQATDSLYAARALNGLGKAFAAKSEYLKSLEYHYDALNYLEHSTSNIELAYAHNNIGLLYGRFNLYDEALEYLMEAERYIALDETTDENNFNNLLLLNISILKGRQGDNNGSLNYVLKAEKSLKESDVQFKGLRMAITANEKARTYLQLGRIDSALILAERNIVPLARANIPFALGKGYYYLGEIYRVKGDFNKALEYAKKADLIAGSIDDLATKQDIYHLVATMYEEVNNPKKALEYYKKATEINNEIFDVKDTWAFYKLKRDIKTKDEAQQNALLEKDKKLSRTMSGLYAVIVIFTIVFAFIYFKYLRTKHKKEKEQYEQLQQLTQIELQKTKEVLEINKKELTSAALQIIENGETVQQFRKEIESFKESLDTSHHKKLENLASSITNNTTKNWEEFRSRFEQVNTDFFKNLKKEHPELSSNELKICSFLKLNFNSKDIANLMGISPESVKVSRYRLRKKLNLQRSDNLASYIDQF